jgi:molybdopterin molybdotransferase
MLIAPQEALERALDSAAPLSPERRTPDQTLGCVLAEALYAQRDMPLADRSAMDGYAVRRDDLATCPVALELSGEVAAGSPAQPRVLPGRCVRIFTGANVPPGADTVVMVEQTVEQQGRVRFRAAPERGANILRRGEDARAGQLLLPEGTVMKPAAIALACAVGRKTLQVFPRPHVTVLCTGRELRETDQDAILHQQRDANGPALSAALEQWNGAAVPCRLVPDDLAAIVEQIRRATADCDVLITTGGVSVGRYDFVPEAVQQAGGHILFHGVSMKPGKPTLLARLDGGTLVFGLPGNPLSALVAFHEFVLPVLRRLAGTAVQACRSVWRLPLAEALPRKGDRVRHVLARVAWDAEGPRLWPVPSMSSADLVAGGKADGTIVAEPGPGPIPAGTRVTFRPWRPLP